MSEIGKVNLFARKFLWPPRQRHPTLLKAIDTITDLHGLRDVLLDEHYAGAILFDTRHRIVDVANYNRRQAKADLVAQQYALVRHQRASDRSHLLLSAASRVALHRSARC